MPLTPADVHNVAFKKPSIGKRGYDEDEVDAFLDVVEAELSRLIEENAELAGRLSDRASPLPWRLRRWTPPRPPPVRGTGRQYRARRTPRRPGCCGLAQETADRLTDEAKAESERLLAEAKSHSEALVGDATTRAEAAERDSKVRPRRWTPRPRPGTTR